MSTTIDQLSAFLTSHAIQVAVGIGMIGLIMLYVHSVVGPSGLPACR
jgi:hypothetical protein